MLQAEARATRRACTRDGRYNTLVFKGAIFWGSVVLLTGLGFFVFPGHTYLQADTQIYVPMMERIYNPVLFLEDPMITRPHLALTAYDEIAIALRSYAGLNFENGLKLQQILFRACAVAGLLLIALRLGLAPPAAFFVAGMAILNGTGITEPEPVARSFALGLLLLGVGLASSGRFLAAGMAGALGFLIHPTTMGPFWCLAVLLVLRRTARPILLLPFLPAVGVLALLMHFQAGGTERLDFFRALDPFQEGLQRRFMPLVFVTEWNAKKFGDLICQMIVVVVGFWRLRTRLEPPLRDWLWGFAALAVLSVPFSWIVLDNLHWAMVGPWEPTRALLFISLLVSVLSSACGIFATRERIWWEALVWFGIALALPVKDALVTWYVNPWLIALVVALAVASTLGAWLSGRARGVAIVAAGILPFIALPASGLALPPVPVDSPELRQLAAWANTKTDETAIFLFADEGRYGGSGPFRARALRSIYVDYEGRALVNYFPAFAAEWARRWRDVKEGSWQMGPDDFRQVANWRIDFVILRTEHAIASRQSEFSNSHYVVYRVIPPL